MDASVVPVRQRYSCCMVACYWHAGRRRRMAAAVCRRPAPALPDHLPALTQPNIARSKSIRGSLFHCYPSTVGLTRVSAQLGIRGRPTTNDQTAYGAIALQSPPRVSGISLWLFCLQSSTGDELTAGIQKWRCVTEREFTFRVAAPTTMFLVWGANRSPTSWRRSNVIWRWSNRQQCSVFAAPEYPNAA